MLLYARLPAALACQRSLVTDAPIRLDRSKVLTIWS